MNLSMILGNNFIRNYYFNLIMILGYYELSNFI